MLKPRRRLATAALLAALALAAPAAAMTLDMDHPGTNDPWLLIPLPDGSTVITNKLSSPFNGEPAGIVLPDGTWWWSGDETAPIRYAAARSGPYTSLPALPSGQVPSHWALGANNTLWFTEAISNPQSEAVFVDRIGRVDTVAHTAQEFGGLSRGANAQSIVAGPDGNAWFMEFGINSIGRITPSGAVTEYPLPASVRLGGSRGREMAFGPGNDLYFLVAGGVGRMSLSGAFLGVIDGGLTDYQPNSLAYAKDGNLWTTECGTNLNRVTRISPAGTVTRAPEGSLPPTSCPMGLVTGYDGIPWFYEWNTGRSGRILFDTPLARTDDATSVNTTAADLNGSASPRGVDTKIRFEYGTTAAYGRSTPAQAIGDGDDATDVSARPTDLQPSTAYHYRLVATSVIGTVYGEDQTVTTRAVPPPPPTPLPADRDADGYNVLVDCDDLSAAIHPGARDKPGDRLDQDCSGADASYQRFQPHADAGWKVVKGRIVFTRLMIDEMPAGSSLKLTCTGPGCLLKGYTATMAKPARRLDVTKRLKAAKLRKGARVELTLSRPGYITTVVRWTIGPPPRVSILCLPPGAKKPTAC